MTALAPHLTAFFREHLPRERACSRHTCDAYAYTFQLLLCFAAEQCHTSPSALTLEQLDAPMVLAFLEHIETGRGNSPTTRNARLAAIKSFAHFTEYRVPSAIEQSRRLLAIPAKKTDQALVDYLTHQGIQVLLDTPDPRTRFGTRDRAMLHLSFAAGLRVSELIGLRLDEVQTHPQASIHVRGKGRRERVLPLWKETTHRAASLACRARGEPCFRAVSERASGATEPFRLRTYSGQAREDGSSGLPIDRLQEHIAPRPEAHLCDAYTRGDP